MTHMYGTTVLTSHYEEITFDEEIDNIKLCVDTNAPVSKNDDFEGLEFTESDGTL